MPHQAHADLSTSRVGPAGSTNCAFPLRRGFRFSNCIRFRFSQLYLVPIQAIVFGSDSGNCLGYESASVTLVPIQPLANAGFEGSESAMRKRCGLGAKGS